MQSMHIINKGSINKNWADTVGGMNSNMKFQSNKGVHNK